jgi:predicted anti-sigma-YlaC factor YlaD
MNRLRFVLPPAGLALVAALSSGCSIRGYAINKVGDALAGTGSSFAADDDPQLIGDASPFGLKTMEALLEESPRHKGLLLAATRGFVQYAYGWIQMDADAIEATDLARATAMRERCRKLYLRARDYGLRGLEVDLPGLRGALARDPKTALAKAKKEQVPLLYWTAMAWGAVLSLNVNDTEVNIDQPAVEALARRALELDEGWGLGSIHEFLLAWEAGHSTVGGSMEKAREHYQKALAFGGDKRAILYVTYAQSVCIPTQDKKQFQESLEKALALDVSQPSDRRLANIIAQKRARWQLGRQDELFVE